MNKKAYLSNFVFGFIGLAVLILVLVALLAVDKGDINPETIKVAFDNASSHVMSNLQVNESNSPIINVVYSFANFMIYSTFEVAKAGISYGVAHPEVVNPQVLFWIIIISLSIPIVWYAFLIGTSIFLITKEWYLNRKEKRLLNR